MKAERVAPTDPEIFRKSVKLGTMKQVPVTVTMISALINHDLVCSLIFRF